MAVNENNKVNETNELPVVEGSMKEVKFDNISKVAMVTGVSKQKGTPYTMIKLSVESKVTGKTLEKFVFLNETEIFFLTGK